MEEQRKERTVDELAAENDALRKKADELNKEIEYLQQQVNFLKKSVFGSKSEKKVLHNTENPEQLSLFNEAETEARREEAEEVSVPAHKRKKKRSRAEILKELPVEEVIHEVEDRICDKCGSEMKQVGKEFVHDELVYVPAKMFIQYFQSIFEQFEIIEYHANTSVTFCIILFRYIYYTFYSAGSQYFLKEENKICTFLFGGSIVHNYLLI